MIPFAFKVSTISPSVVEVTAVTRLPSLSRISKYDVEAVIADDT